jgi:molybdopterin-guanine dinucleotide biosynthesis protein A
MPDSIAGYILAGGTSRRMGKDKARLTLGGESFVERIAREVRAVTDSVTLVGGRPVPELNALQHTPDVIPNWGTLGGVHAALSVCQANWALVVGCDFPLVTTELFLYLLSLRAGYEAVAPIQDDGIPQPLCSLYRVRPCLQITEQLIKSGERKPVALLQSVRTRWVSFAELSSLRGANHFFDNVNTPEDYRRVSKWVLSEDVTVND